MLDSPAAERNKEPILSELRNLLPQTGLVLEVASGTGQHVMHFAQALPALEWQPSDPDEDLLASIRQRLAAHPLANVAAPLNLDVLSDPWPLQQASAILCINMIHIAPWAATEALFYGASKLLASAAPLILYGPYRRNGRHTSASNESFDTSLRARNPAWGVRDLERVTALAGQHAISLDGVISMPANNVLVALRSD